MKRLPYFLFAVLIFFGCGWVAYEKAEVSALKTKNTALRQQLETADGSLRAETKAKTSESQESAIQLNTRSADELLIALNRLAATETDEKDQLIFELIQQLAQLDPVAALDWLMASENGSLKRGLIPLTFSKWISKDSTKATAWYDQKLAEGNFATKALDGSNDKRCYFEGQVLNSIFAKNPAAAEARLLLLPMELRKGALERLDLSQADDASRRLYIELLRNHLPENDKNEIFGVALAALPYPKMSEFLQQMQTTPAERDAAVSVASRLQIDTEILNDHKAPAEAVSAMRQWATQESAAQADQLTGKAVAQLLSGGKMTPSGAVAYIESCIQQGGDPNTLAASMLQNYWPSERADNEPLRALAARITDEKSRENVLKRLK